MELFKGEYALVIMMLTNHDSLAIALNVTCVGIIV
jgi:hypothetical protein